MGKYFISLSYNKFFLLSYFNKCEIDNSFQKYSIITTFYLRYLSVFLVTLIGHAFMTFMIHYDDMFHFFIVSYTVLLCVA